MLEKQIKKQRRHNRVRAKMSGTNKIPRLCVFRSSKHISAQLIDDEKGKTLLFVNDLNLKLKKGQTKVDIAHCVGEEFAKQAKDKKIEQVVFDRGGYKYHGRVKALAEGARGGGLKF